MKKGFTLLEILIVISIIGLLLMLIVPQVTGVRSEGRDTVRKSHLNDIATAVEVFRSQEGRLPDLNGVVTCLSDDEANNDLLTLRGLFKENKFPTAPSKNTNKVGDCHKGVYALLMAAADSEDDEFFVLTTLENEKNHNGQLDSNNTVTAGNDINNVYFVKF